ncbi:hypothetical protein ACX0G9_17340 [Flavitalea flava]
MKTTLKPRGLDTPCINTHCMNTHRMNTSPWDSLSNRTIRIVLFLIAIFYCLGMLSCKKSNDGTSQKNDIPEHRGT